MRAEFAAGDWALTLAPGVGGAVAALRHRGRDVLRPAPPGCNDPLQMGCFPLIPYANRIAHGRFRLGDETVQLPRNFGDHPHALHGTGWQSRWALAQVPGLVAMLVQDHGGSPGWPWPYRAEQRFTAGPSSFTITLSLRNTGNRTLPMGLGLHPYFPADAATRLQVALGAPWLSDGDCLPTARGAAGCLGDWQQGAPVQGERLIDHCFAAAGGDAFIDNPGAARLRLCASPNLGWWHLYRPPHADFFCIEPVSHMPDAVNRAEPPAETGLTMVEPGAVISGALTLAVA